MMSFLILSEAHRSSVNHRVSGSKSRTKGRKTLEVTYSLVDDVKGGGGTHVSKQTFDNLTSLHLSFNLLFEPHSHLQNSSWDDLVRGSSSFLFLIRNREMETLMLVSGHEKKILVGRTRVSYFKTAALIAQPLSIYCLPLLSILLAFTRWSVLLAQTTESTKVDNFSLIIPVNRLCHGWVSSKGSQATLTLIQSTCDMTKNSVLRSWSVFDEVVAQ